jgi:hypothetical protein
MTGRKQVLKEKTDKWVQAENDRSGACYRLVQSMQWGYC